MRSPEQGATTTRCRSITEEEQRSRAGCSGDRMLPYLLWPGALSLEDFRLLGLEGFIEFFDI